MGSARSGRGVSQELWARVAWDVIELARGAGVDVWAACEGLSFDPGSVRRQRRVSWEDYCTLTERVAERVGGLEALASLSEDRYHDTTPELTALAAAIVSPKALYRLMYEIFSPVIFPMVAFSYDDLGPTTVHVEAWLRAGTRPCLALHYGVLGAMRGLPKHLGLPPAEVTGETEADHVAWDIEVPASRTLIARASRLSSRVIARARATAVVLGSESDGTPVSMGVGSTTFDVAEARLHDAQLQWKLTPRQAEVLRGIVDGKSNKEIAQELGRAENTVELHVTQLLRRAGVGSRTQLIARLFADGSLVAEAGDER